ncbi:MAG: bifunctional hydroxymethylpyrimidine kinase/phosphomethylpyrimidine kinase [Corallococcus sp.]|nr:bifunctional hydroxymethylpyrimidine kinase/phosphomethylpyrimidine kinase [Corallococcus sp.]MCM1358991.1 bifunctional hydroxymethylpyrimidine kinase/phosphomethylpyrimidine kinase [Corallococcus sp.]MCM1394980.1 bifunctional hydroxymethylpyrimidine kinase/phosphomethylpyrimidine kinase [Corallococcus sp.]
MKNVLIFNDISGLGNCSLVANLSIFSKLGHYCMPVVTATYSRQTGFKTFTCQKNASLSASVADVTSQRVPDAVYVGFCADTVLLTEIEKQTAKLSSDTLKFVDPVMGDNGVLYPVFDACYVAAMKSLVKGAFCISPNLTEACLLADIDYNELISYKNEPAFLARCGKVFQDFCDVLDVQSAVITGVQCGNLLGNVVLQRGKKVQFVTNERILVNFSGTGDAFSSVLLGEILCGADVVAATQIAANFVCKAASLTECGDSRFGVEFSRVLDLL